VSRQWQDNPVNGIINLLKPAGMTSHDAVQVVRRLLGQRRVGHGGTLDPGATGVLPLFLGWAARLISYTPGTKAYRVELTLVIGTDTLDGGGKTLGVADDLAVSPRQLGEAFAAFLGEIEQIPPMLSARRLGGRRLYELARQGLEVEREPRRVRILELHIRKIWPEDASVLGLGSRVLFDVQCSAGTYIRTLCADIGSHLGSPAHMSFLVRTAAGPFQLADAVTFEELQAAATHGRLADYVLSPDAALLHLPVITVGSEALGRLAQGGAFAALEQPPEEPSPPGSVVRVHSEQNRLLALATPAASGAPLWQPIRVFC
jgi:tRNA pseudouridine55 synthase